MTPEEIYQRALEARQLQDNVMRTLEEARAGDPAASMQRDANIFPGGRTTTDLIGLNLGAGPAPASALAQQPNMGAFYGWDKDPSLGGLGLAGSPGSQAAASPATTGEPYSWVDALRGVGGALEAFSAGVNGRTPLFMLQQQQDANMKLRRDAIAQQQAQAEETKRQHDLQLFEKAMASPRAPQMMEALGQNQNYSLAKQAKQFSRVMKEADYGALKSYQSFIPDEIQQKFIKGELNDFELGEWVNQARTAAKENAKEEAKATLVKRAMSKPADQRSPYEQQLVEEREAALAVKEADELLKLSTAMKNMKEAEAGPQDKGLGHDREAFTKQLFGKDAKYSNLEPGQMEQVNREVATFQGTLAANRATAQQTAQLKVPDKPTSTERKELTDDVATIERIDSLESLYKPSFVGPLRGRYGSMLELVGGIGEDEADFKAEVATLKNQVIKQITGAQMSEPEAKRIMRQIPDENNPPTVFEARLKRTRENVTMLAKKRREILSKSGIDVSNLPPLPGSAPSNKVQSVLDEVLGK